MLEIITSGTIGQFLGKNTYFYKLLLLFRSLFFKWPANLRYWENWNLKISFLVNRHYIFSTLSYLMWNVFIYVLEISHVHLFFLYLIYMLITDIITDKNKIISISVNIEWLNNMNKKVNMENLDKEKELSQISDQTCLAVGAFLSNSISLYIFYLWTRALFDCMIMTMKFHVTCLEYITIWPRHK